MFFPKFFLAEIGCQLQHVMEFYQYYWVQIFSLTGLSVKNITKIIHQQSFLISLSFYEVVPQIAIMQNMKLAMRPKTKSFYVWYKVVPLQFALYDKMHNHPSLSTLFWEIIHVDNNSISAQYTGSFLFIFNIAVHIYAFYFLRSRVTRKPASWFVFTVTF